MAGVLEILGLEKRFGDTWALRGLSFEVREGEVFGFVGSNGAGKTTTMRIAMGVLAPDRGEVRWAGAPLGFAARQRFGYMPEERGLYPTMRLGEQLQYLARLHGLRQEDARRSAELWLERLGLLERAGDEVQVLSHGNQQRAQLAAALVFSPAALILDEPFAGLDPVAVDVMSGVLREQAQQGVPVLFSSHQLELVERLCDRVGIIRGGQMVAVGTVAELAKDGGERLWVDVGSDESAWAFGIPGVSVLRQEGTRTLLALDGGSDDQAVLRAAIRQGPVREFRRDVPPLGELFRNAVSEEVAR